MNLLFWILIIIINSKWWIISSRHRNRYHPVAASSGRENTASMTHRSRHSAVNSKPENKWVKKRYKALKRKAKLEWCRLRNYSNSKLWQHSSRQWRNLTLLTTTADLELTRQVWTTISLQPIRTVKKMIWSKCNSTRKRSRKSTKWPSWCDSKRRRWTLMMMAIRRHPIMKCLNRSNKYWIRKIWQTWRLSRRRMPAGMRTHLPCKWYRTWTL